MCYDVHRDNFWSIIIKKSICFLLPNRVFPTRRRGEVEQLLQKFRGDIVQAMEVMLSGRHSPSVSPAEDDPSVAANSTAQRHSSSPPLQSTTNAAFPPLKSAFSPLVPPGVFNAAAAAGRYPFLQQHQQHAKRFLSAPYAGTGFLSSIIQSANACSEAAAAAAASAANGGGTEECNGNRNNVTDRCGSGGGVGNDSQEW